MRLSDQIPGAPARIERQIAAELAAAPPGNPHLPDFLAGRILPVPVEVQVPGGICLDAWAVTRSTGRHTVVWLPGDGPFSPTVDGRFAPLDIGMHGPAPACSPSV